MYITHWYASLCLTDAKYSLQLIEPEQLAYTFYFQKKHEKNEWMSALTHMLTKRCNIVCLMQCQLHVYTDNDCFVLLVATHVLFQCSTFDRKLDMKLKEEEQEIPQLRPHVDYRFVLEQTLSFTKLSDTYYICTCTCAYTFT